MLATEKEICEEIVRLNGCPVMFIKNGTCFAGCDYCPFTYKKKNGLVCCHRSFWDNHEEVVKNAKEFLKTCKEVK